MLNPKPYVQLACICEKALVEPDSVCSLIRVVDTYTLDPPTAGLLPAGADIALPLTIIVSLKSGEVTGEREIGLQLMKPDGGVSPIHKWPVVFAGGESGVNLRVGFALTPPQYGLHWFEVLFDGEVLTRIPLRLELRTARSVGEAEPTPTVTTQQ